MTINIFYTWQSRTDNRYNRDLIRAAIDTAKKNLSQINPTIKYEVVENLNNDSGFVNIPAELKDNLDNKCDIIVSDYTNIGDNQHKKSLWDRCLRIFKKGRAKSTVESIVNPNVIKEESYVANRIGRRIIRVSNAYYGKYGEDIHLHFDSDQERYPIEYKCYEESNREQVIEKLASSLQEAIRIATIDYREDQDTRYNPFHTMECPEVKDILSGKYFDNDKIKSLLNELRNYKDNFRIVGFSGLGKTRAVCEAFKDSDNYSIFYCNCSNVVRDNIREGLKKLLREKQRGLTVILDNCEFELLEDLMYLKQIYKAECRFISLNYDMGERNPHRQNLVFRTLDLDFSKGVVENMVALRHLKDEDAKLVIKYSSGLPYMAKLLLNNNFSNELSQIPQNQIYDRILNIDRDTEENKRRRIVLTSISIFQGLGFFDDMREDMEFVAKNQILTHWDVKDDKYKIQEFAITEKQYEERGVIERLGNMVSMRPIPVALYLAGEWYRTLDEASMVQLCDDFVNYQNGYRLVEALAVRTTKMGQFPEARQLVDRLTGPCAPFHKKEVVFSELGSRLFLAFVEVNPVACANAIWDIVSGLTLTVQKTLNRRGRSNILFALDHLCFDHRSFRNGMLSLAKLSLFEPEEYDNNSIGLFVERFHIILPSTEANFDARLEVLREVKEWGGDFYYIVFKSCLSAMMMGSFYRMGGPEYQGDDKLTDYIPQTRDEIISYQDQILELLFPLCDLNGDWLEKASQQFTENIWQYFRQGHISIIKKCFEYFYPHIGNKWPEIKRALRLIIDTDEKILPPEYIALAREWLAKVTPMDFVSRYQDVDNQVSYHGKIDIDEQNRQRVIANNALAKEFVEHKFYDQDTVNGVYNSDKLFTNVFAQGIVSLVDNDFNLIKLFTDMSLLAIGDADALPDKFSLFVYFAGLLTNKEGFLYIHDKITTKDNLRYLVLAISALRMKSVDDIEPLLSKINTKYYQVEDFRWVIRYANLLSISQNTFLQLFNRLMDCGEDGARLALNYVGSRVWSEQKEDPKLETTAARMYSMIDIHRDRTIDDFTYYSGIKTFLSKYHHPELALRLHHQIENALLNSLFNQPHAQEIYGVVLKEYKDVVWPVLKESLEDKQKLDVWADFLSMNYVIDSNLDNPPLSSLVSDEEWKDWLDHTSVEKDFAASRLLVMIRWYKDDGSLYPLFASLMEEHFVLRSEFADDFITRHHLFSYIGTGQPLYELRMTVDDNLAKLNNRDLREWASADIKHWKALSKKERLEVAHREAMSDRRP